MGNENSYCNAYYYGDVKLTVVFQLLVKIMWIKIAWRFLQKLSYWLRKVYKTFWIFWRLRLFCVVKKLIKKIKTVLYKVTTYWNYIWVTSVVAKFHVEGCFCFFKVLYFAFNKLHGVNCECIFAVQIMKDIESFFEFDAICS